jgi:hypothetical protein
MRTYLSVLSKIFSACVRWIDEHHSFRLRAIPVFYERFCLYNAALHECLLNSVGEVPIEAQDNCCFLDTTSITVSRPQVIIT